MSHPLYFVRHGETDWNAQGRLQGQKDIPLNERGRLQAETAGRILLSLGLDVTTSLFWSSPLIRTRQTMEGLRLAMGLPAQPYGADDRLKELAFGHWEGLTWPEVKLRDPALATARERDKWNVQPPEGESYVMLSARLKPFLDTLKGPSIIVSHGGVGRVLMRELGGKDEDAAAETYIHQGVVYLFEGGKARLIKA